MLHGTRNEFRNYMYVKYILDITGSGPYDRHLVVYPIGQSTYHRDFQHPAVVLPHVGCASSDYTCALIVYALFAR